MSSKLRATINASSAWAVAGCNTGWQDTASASWQYLDLSYAEGRYVRIENRTESTYFCFVVDSTVTPSTADTNDTKTENLAFVLAADEKEQFVVPEGATTLAFKQVTGAGTFRVHIT